MDWIARGRHWRWWAGTVAVPVGYAAAVTLLVSALQSISVEGGVAGLERQALGWMLLHRPAQAVDPGIVLIALDTPLYESGEARALEPSSPPGTRPLTAYRKPDCACPLIPRECYALAVERLAKWGARATVLDIMFRQPGFTPTDRAEEERLGKALLQAGNVVAAAPTDTLALDRSRDPTRTSDLLVSRPIPAVDLNAAEVGSPKVDPRDMEYALELLQTAHLQSGEMQDLYALPYLAHCIAEGKAPEDLRRWKSRLVEGTQPRLLGSLFTRSTGGDRKPTAAAKPAEGQVELITSGNVTMDEAFYQKRLLINYLAGSDPNAGRFRPVRLSWVLTCSDEEGRRRFRNRIALIGNPATDQHRTLVGAMPGTEVLANALQTLLEDRPIVPVPTSVTLWLTFLAALLAAVVVRQLPFLAAGPLMVLEVWCLGWLGRYLLEQNMWLLTVTPVAGVVVTVTVTGLFALRTVQSMVARLVPERLSRQLERMGGTTLESGSVLFSDIRGYSTFSEFMDPAATMSCLNVYFGSVQVILDRYGGHFMKSPGDCVIAWFSEEKRGSHHAERAIRAAIELVMNAVRFRSQWPSEMGQPFDIGVGINTGPMALGFLDTRRHLEPTVIGDTVNLASRLESLTKQYRATIIVSESTLAPVRELFVSEPLGEAIVKGRTQEVTIHRIIGLADTAPVVEPLRWWKPKGKRRQAFVFRAPDEVPREPAALEEELDTVGAASAKD